MKKYYIFKFLKYFILLYLAYFLITGVLIFLRTKPVSDSYLDFSSTIDYFSDDISSDRAILLDDPLDSALARLKIIDQANVSLNVAYFSIESGMAPDFFFACLLDAADRGVEVNILLDGVFNGLRGKKKASLYTILDHPNINLKFFEPFNPFMPWTLNNRMHDKMIIADSSIAMIGGRNIGDKYFDPDWYNSKVTFDRDIVIINPDMASDSVVIDMEDYYMDLWNSKFSKTVSKKLTRFRNFLARRNRDKFKELSLKTKDLYKDFFSDSFSLVDYSFPINKATFIHNPIGRFSKEPWLLYELSRLIKGASSSVLIQSPYIVPNRQIQAVVDINPDIDFTILTNSLASTPNLPAFSGYLNYRKPLVDMGFNVYEFQSKDSIHSKALLVDDDLVAIGTFNADPRSAFLSTESMLVIHSPEAASSFKEGLVPFFDSSLLVGEDYNYVLDSNIKEVKASFFKILLFKVASLMVRLFDFLL